MSGVSIGASRLASGPETLAGCGLDSGLGFRVMGYGLATPPMASCLKVDSTHLALRDWKGIAAVGASHVETTRVAVFV